MNAIITLLDGTKVNISYLTGKTINSSVYDLENVKLLTVV